MIYLASPYSHPDPFVRKHRYEAAVAAAAELWRRGHVAFSPIAHSHPIAQQGVSGAWAQWIAFDTAILAVCDEIRVLMLDGYAESVGIREELEIARELGKVITYWDGVGE